jgi:OmpA-OmpF porin, OOP family
MYKIIITITALFLAVSSVNAQFSLDKLKKKVKDKVEKRVDKNIDKTIDKTLDKTEEGAAKAVDGKHDVEKEEPKDQSKSSDLNNETNSVGINEKTDIQNKSANVQWNKYDFVPGDIVIFEDDLSGEQNGEFPSKWDLTKGTIENAVLDGENVIYFIQCNTNGGGGIVPLIKNSNEDYLPEEFTVEFDAFFEKPRNSYSLYLFDSKNQRKLDKGVNASDKWIRFSQNSIDGHNISSCWYPGTSERNTKSNPGWRHVAVSFNKRALKAYLDDSRVINIPNLNYNPTGITLGFHNPSGNSKGYIKNIRIAKGAVPLYDKMMTDGKIVTTGIKFDINKSIIKPESMGVINEIVSLMKNKPELKFSVEGHTDSDGETSANQKLSEARAKSVMNKMIELGIVQSRLKAKGLGESKPAVDNNTPEGKANNRRVEFVKF